MYSQLGVDQETDACSWRESSACLARAHTPSVWWVGGGVPVNESDQSVQLNKFTELRDSAFYTGVILYTPDTTNGMMDTLFTG